MNEKRLKAIEEIFGLIQSRRNEGRIVFQVSDKELISQPLSEFVRQGFHGMLYDLNRLDEVLLTLAKSEDKVDLIDFLVNELGMVTLIGYLVNENNKLKEELNKLN